MFFVLICPVSTCQNVTPDGNCWVQIWVLNVEQLICFDIWQIMMKLICFDMWEIRIMIRKVQMPDICHNNRQLWKRNSTGTLLVHNMYYIPATNVDGLGQRTAVLFPEFRFSLKHKSQLDFNFATVVRFPNPRAGTYGDLLYNISRNGATPFFCHNYATAPTDVWTAGL